MAKKQSEIGFGGKTFGKNWKHEPLKSRVAHDFGTKGIKKSPKGAFKAGLAMNTGIYLKGVPKETLHERTTTEGRIAYRDKIIAMEASKKKRKKK